MMKNMGMMPKGGKFNQNAFNSKMEEMTRGSKMRDRMKTKLDANRKQQEEQETKTQTQTQTQTQSSENNMKTAMKNNLDFLFSNNGGDNSDLSRLNGDLQKLVEEMKQVNSNVLNSANESTNNKKKKKGKKA